MKKIWRLFRELPATVNFDALRCTIKGDPSTREIIGALKRQKELDAANRQTPAC